MEKLSLRQRSVRNLVANAKSSKRIIEQWLFYATLRYMQLNKFTEAQELLLEDAVDFFVKYLDSVEFDEDFLKKVELEPIQIPAKTK